MFDAIASVIGSGLGYIGTKETNAANKEMADSANDANERLAQENRAWQERMANTAHQREVNDLKNAGLNPILSATGGSGSATPSGNAATHNAAKMENALGNAVSSGLASANLTKDLEMADSQKALNASAVQTQESQQILNNSSAQKTRQDAIKVAQDNNIRDPALATMRAATTQQAEADLKKAKMDNQMATFDSIQKRVDNTLNTASSAKDLLNPIKLLNPFNSPKSPSAPSKKPPSYHPTEKSENFWRKYRD